MSPPPRVTLLRSVDPPEWWRQLDADATIFCQTRWLRSVGREQDGQRHLWLHARDPETGAAGAIRSTLVDRSSTKRSLDVHHWLFAQTAYRQGVVCASPTGEPTRAEWLPALVSVYPGLEFGVVGPATIPVAEALLAASVEAARAHGAKVVALGFVQPRDRILRAAAHRQGFVGFHLATLSTLHLAGRTAERVFADYGQKQRASFRRTRRLLAGQGVGVRVLPDPADHLDTLVALRCAHLVSHGRPADVAQEREHLRLLFEHFAAEVSVLVAERDGSPRGFSLFLADGDTLHAYLVGRSDPVADRDIYFELNYYSAVELAVRGGYDRISYGYGTQEAKRLRGCRQERVYGYVYPCEGRLREYLPVSQPSEVEVW